MDLRSEKLLMQCHLDDIQYIGSVTKTGNSAGVWDSSGEAIDVLSLATTGDLVVIAFSFDVDADSTWSWSGMSFTDVYNQTGVANPGAYVGYRFVQAGDTNPFVTNVGSNWLALSVVASVFRRVNVYTGAASAVATTGLLNPPSLTASGRLWVATGHADQVNVTSWVAPQNYTIASSASRTTPADEDSSTFIAYRIAELSSDDPGAFSGFSGSTGWRATTLAFD